MRPEWRFGLAALAACALGALGATSYARLATPYYTGAARLVASGHPWTVVSVGVGEGKGGQGNVLRLVGDVRRPGAHGAAAATVVNRIQVGEVVENPVVFWTVVLAWPARGARQRLWRGALGVLVFLGLEVATTVCQLLWGLAYASAVLAGAADPLTLWERWSRFLEAGGQFVVALVAAVVTVAAAERIAPAPAATAAPASAGALPLGR